MINWDTAVLGAVHGVFGEPVIYTPAIGLPYTVHGVFDEAYSPLELASGFADVSTRRPVLGVRDSEFAATPKQSDQLTVVRTGVTYIVKADGHGETKVLLNYVSG